jgi:hypothetical protein
VRRYLLTLAAAALALSCGGDSLKQVTPEIRVRATHRDEAGAPYLDFGPVPVLNVKTLELAVDDLGQADLLVTAIRFEPSDGPFSIDEQAFPIEVPQAGTVVIPVRFRPPAEESYQGTLIVEHDDPEQAPVEVRLLGEGSTIGRIEVSPDALDFGRVGEAEQKVLGIRIASAGTAPLILETLELAPGSAPEFSFAGSAQTPATLPAPGAGTAGGEVELRIRCAPTGDTRPDRLEGTVRIVSTDPDRREVLVPLSATLNRAPVAAIADPQGGNAAPGDTVSFDGTGSTDPDGDLPLSFAWRVYRRPIDSAAAFADPTSATPSLVLDQPGEYEIGLDVADSAGLSCAHPQGDARVPCARTTVLAKPADDVFVELVWDHPTTDLDLHFLEGAAALYSSKDCYFDNPAPDFGEFGSLLDDPELIRDDLNGYGPERIVLTRPSPGTYAVKVVYFSDHGSPNPASRATVRVYIYGVLAAELSRVLDGPGLLWDALRLDWPNGALTAVDTVGEAPAP